MTYFRFPCPLVFSPLSPLWKRIQSTHLTNLPTLKLFIVLPVSSFDGPKILIILWQKEWQKHLATLVTFMIFRKTHSFLQFITFFVSLTCSKFCLQGTMVSKHFFCNQSDNFSVLKMPPTTSGVQIMYPSSWTILNSKLYIEQRSMKKIKHALWKFQFKEILNQQQNVLFGWILSSAAKQ